ncbi:MAG: carboxypeptidase regulatory-like domain-containing protein, partial [Planctomycetes bacterium]|nr:carboxypeptidase regulatory-like domain-containing protein [Planctomycetota bacterium]
GVATGREELVIRLPEAAWVWMTGTVVGPDGGLPANVQASPSLVGGNWGTPVETVDPNDGSFRFGPYPPGTYRLMFQADGLPRLRFERKLGADETWDLGTVRFPRGGHLAVQLLGSLALPAKLRLGITDPANGAALERVDLENGIGRSRPLAPGDYQLEVHGEGFASQIVPFSIRAEQETKLDVELAEGFAAKLTIELPAGRQRGGSIDLEVRDESGRLIRRLTASSSGKAPSQSLSLASGRYRVSASWQDCSATAGFEVGGRSAQTTTVLRLQPR